MTVAKTARRAGKQSKKIALREGKKARKEL